MSGFTPTCSPPGYVGYGEGGVLTEAVRRKPYSIVLLDEVEKAHPDVLELFFQVFDKGIMEDSSGREVDFKNTIIILTSNVGTQQIMQAVKYSNTPEDICQRPTPKKLQQLLRAELQQVFKPAFLARLTLVPYYPIDGAVMTKIIDLKLKKVMGRLMENHGTSLIYQNNVIDMLVSRCTDIDSGARDADAVITQSVLSTLSDQILTKIAADEAVKSVELKVKKGVLTALLK